MRQYDRRQVQASPESPVHSGSGICQLSCFSLIVRYRNVHSRAAEILSFALIIDGVNSIGGREVILRFALVVDRGDSIDNSEVS